MGFGPRSAIERFFSVVDDRYRAFYERFPFRSSLENLATWMAAFAGVYVLKRALR